ncbi:MAG TPA: VCBS repeat-containing protein [Sandaracinaceae bacterium LLY-WYZ-13_1]|nr:VCBS repeat-containing protein [Sandaracinaceae bacterium LLY-WYZ-13_1]
MNRFGAKRVAAMAALLGALGLVSGCECDPEEASLMLTEPEDETVLSFDSDTNPDIEGVQIVVRGVAMGLAVGDEVELELDDVAVATTTVNADGDVVWPDITIPSGMHSLGAVAGEIESEDIEITLEGMCFSMTFVTPEPAGDEVTLGPGDDTDGEMCGDTFETTVVVSTSAPDGTEARVYVNDTPRRTARVMGGAVRFEGVGFDNRGATANNLRVEIPNAAGTDCGADFPRPIFVDCEGASCAITDPATDRAYLNQSDDVSDAEGFQTDFRVETDMEGSGNEIRLIIDGDESGAESTTPDGTTATFGNVELSEGVHRVVAECRDDAGNVTRSGPAEWTVDITPCGVAIEDPTEGVVYIDADDLDDGVMGTQVAMSGTAGADCDGIRLGQCPSIDTMTFETDVSESWSGQVTLSSSAMQDLCAETRDEAGNISTAMVGVRYNSDDPQLAIDVPASGACFNIDGVGGCEADLMDGNNSCEAAFEVFCSGVGEDVTIVRTDTGTTLGTETCVADASVPSPYTGKATFAMVSLPTVGSWDTFPVVARQTVDRLDGESTAVSLQSDCVAPELTISRPTCGGRLFPATQDESADPGFQYRTDVQNPLDPESDVTLTIQPAGGGAPVYMETDTTTSSIRNFPNANYGAGGMLEVVVTATDEAGNVGSNAPPACVVTVEDLPTVNITEPTMGDVLSASDDCSSDAGLQVSVTGTTDASAGETVEVNVDGAPVITSGTVGSGGAISECVDVPDGRSVMIEVVVTDSRGSSAAAVTVTVDTMTPTDAIDDLTASVVDRRAGVVRFSWTAVSDAGGLQLESYVMRCSDAPIASETDWDGAGDVELVSTPGTAGSVQTEDVDAFRPGETRYCVLRGVDPAGSLTPLPASSTELTIDFLEQTVSAAGTSSMGEQLAAVGDVNGDGIDDVVVGGAGEVYLYFGSSSGLSSSPDVTILSTAAAFGSRVAGLGDINGDGRSDFAIGAWRAAGFKGRVYVFFGRDSMSPWSSTCDLDVGCSADLVVESDDGAPGGPDDFATLGFSVSSAGDFDGDGLMDIAIGAFGSSSLTGRLYVLRGSSSLGGTISVPGSAGSEPEGFVAVGPEPNSSFGASVSSIGGDVTTDGRHDLIVGSPGNDMAAVAGRAFFVRGQSYTGTGLQSIPAAAVSMIDSGSDGSFGDLVAGAGDLDDDGRLDVAVYDLGSGSRGQIFLYRRTSTGFDVAGRVRISNDAAGDVTDDRMGQTVGIGRHPFLGELGDIDGNGSADTLLGSAQLADGPGTGSFFYQDGTLMDRQRTTASVTFASSSGVGSLVASFIGDVDGDGFADIGLGEPAANGGEGQFIIIH